ncbi:hypothetical protein ACFQ1S_05780 [Kibdelosporangium lantanae]|uniref:Uncharacterized protein n=1 Tax=Kibdelosporangium lantanae TaxID=1497396 RepID=A0ABW3M6C5_9PSEU
MSVASALRPRLSRVRAGISLLGPAFVAAIAYHPFKAGEVGMAQFYGHHGFRAVS